MEYNINEDSFTSFEQAIADMQFKSFNQDYLEEAIKCSGFYERKDSYVSNIQDITMKAGDTDYSLSAEEWRLVQYVLNFWEWCISEKFTFGKLNKIIAGVDCDDNNGTERTICHTDIINIPQYSWWMPVHVHSAVKCGNERHEKHVLDGTITIAFVAMMRKKFIAAKSS